MLKSEHNCKENSLTGRCTFSEERMRLLQVCGLFILIFLKQFLSDVCADELYVALSSNNSAAVDIFDTKIDKLTGHLELGRRVLPIHDAIALYSATPPWVADPAEEISDLRKMQKTGQTTVVLDVFPEAITVAGGKLLGAVGDESSGFVFEVPGTTNAQLKFYDTFQRHTTSIRAAENRVFVSYFNRGVWTVDTKSSKVGRVDDRFDPTVRFIQAGDGGGRPKKARTWVARKPGDRMMTNGCSEMAIGRDGRTLYVAGLDPEDAPVLFFVDIPKARLVEVLRLDADDSSAIIGLATGNDGTVYTATYDNSARVVRLYRFGETTGSVIGSSTIDLGQEGRDENAVVPMMAVGGDRLFLSVGTRLEVFSLGDLRKRESIDLGSPPRSLAATSDGGKIYVTLPPGSGVVPVTVADDYKLVRGAPLAIDGTVGAMAVKR